MDSQNRADLYTTSITQAEILGGIGVMPAGRRRSDLQSTAEQYFDRLYAGRIMPFGQSEASAFAEILADRNRSGRPISKFDALIAAIARHSGFSVATRNVKDFTGCGVTVINPWDGTTTPG